MFMLSIESYAHSLTPFSISRRKAEKMEKDNIMLLEAAPPDRYILLPSSPSHQKNLQSTRTTHFSCSTQQIGAFMSFFFCSLFTSFFVLPLNNYHDYISIFQLSWSKNRLFKTGERIKCERD